MENGSEVEGEGESMINNCRVVKIFALLVLSKVNRGTMLKLSFGVTILRRRRELLDGGARIMTPV